MTLSEFKADLAAVFPGIEFDVEEWDWGFCATTEMARVTVERGLQGGRLYTVACRAASEGHAAASALSMTEAAAKFRSVVDEANKALAQLGHHAPKTTPADGEAGAV